MLVSTILATSLITLISVNIHAPYMGSMKKKNSFNRSPVYVARRAGLLIGLIPIICYGLLFTFTKEQTETMPVVAFVFYLMFASIVLASRLLTLKEDKNAG